MNPLLPMPVNKIEPRHSRHACSETVQGEGGVFGCQAVVMHYQVVGAPSTTAPLDKQTPPLEGATHHCGFLRRFDGDETTYLAEGFNWFILQTVEEGVEEPTRGRYTEMIDNLVTLICSLTRSNCLAAN